MMVRRRDNRGSYRVNSKNHYLVTLVRLENNYYGNPRYEATVINLDNADSFIYSPVYRFTGHYFSEQDEAVWIVGYHENKN